MAKRCLVIVGAALWCVLAAGCGNSSTTPSTRSTQRRTGPAQTTAATPTTTPAIRQHSARHKRRHRRRHTSGLQTVSYVIDGDTIVMAGGAHVRLVQIDTPELSSNECYATQARTDLERMLHAGSRVRLVADPALDRIDRYGRLLRYVVTPGGTNINVALVRRGDAAPYFFAGDRGRYAGLLYADALHAKRARLGLWRLCPGTLLRPDAAVATSSSVGVTGGSSSGGSSDGGSSGVRSSSNCTPGYAPCLVDHGGADYDCAGGSGNGPYFTAPGITYTVSGSDPYDLDADGDGQGCESS